MDGETRSRVAVLGRTFFGACIPGCRCHTLRRLREPLYELARPKQECKEIIAAPLQSGKHQASHAVVQEIVEGESREQLQAVLDDLRLHHPCTAAPLK